MTTAEPQSDIDFSDLEAKFQVSLDECYDNIIIIDNLPKIDESKDEKLIAVLKKNLFKPASANIVEGSVMMPRDPSTGMSRGYMFVELESVEQATAVLKLADGYRLDKSHVLSALKFTDFDRLCEMDETFIEPEIEEFAEKEFLKSWLLDPLARDQFVTCSGNQTNIYYNNRLTAPELVYNRTNWTDGNVKWSPLGSYLMTFHAQGVALWGGASWTRLARFPHQQVKGAFFSPRESYLLTQAPFNPAIPAEPNVFVWDVQTGKVLRAFVIEELATVEAAESNPVLQWSFDDSYASRLAQDHVAIYELPAFSLIDKQGGIKVDNIRLVSWSKTDLNLVYWVPGTESIPSRVALWNLPTRQIIRTKNLFNVCNVTVHWQSEGDFMAVQVDRFAHKNKKTLTSNIELFRLKARDIPVEVVECGSERVDHFSWEPQGSRFLTNQSVEFKSIVTVYQVTENTVKTLHTLERSQLTRWAWSPRGDFFVLAGLNSTSAFLEFWSANEGSMMSSKEHFMATDMEWDPSGRFVASWVSYWRHQMENGFMLWDFRGELISKQMQPRFTAFAWRLRPASPLSKSQLKEIRRNLKTLAAKFEEQDAANQQQSSADTTESKKKVLEEWVMYRMKCQEAFEAKTKHRETLFGKAKSAAKESKIVQEWIEDEVLESSEEIILE